MRDTQWTRRRFLATGSALTAGLAASACRGKAGAGGGGDAEPLRIYTWTSYVDQELVAAFQRRTGIPVEFDTYDSNEVMLAKLQAGGGAAYSLVYPSDYAVSQMVAQDLLLALDHRQLPGIGGLMARYRDPAYDRGNRHSVPIYWGTTGLVYHRKRLSAPIRDWGDLWTRRAELHRKFTLLSDARETIGMALKRLGHSYNTTQVSAVERGFNDLVVLKPGVATFTTAAWQDPLLAGDLVLAMAYSSDARHAMQEDPDLSYVLPASGSSFWTDTMAIPRGAPNPAAAYQWMAMMLEPAIAAQITGRLHVATSVEAARALLPAAARGDATTYPSDAALARCESFRALPAAVNDAYDRYWTRLTSG